jgi:hypothetical protein
MMEVVDVGYDDVEPKLQGAIKSMTTYNNATVMPIPPREEGRVATSIDPNFVLPDVHPVYKNIILRTPSIEKDTAERNVTRANRGLNPVTLSIRHGMLQFLEALAAKRPLWRFEARTAELYTGFVISFDVYHNAENLGYVMHELGYKNGSSTKTDKYKIFNHRISDKLDRRDHKTTTNIATAISTVLKEFGVKSTSELIVAAKAEVNKIADRFVSEKFSVFSSRQWDVREHLMDTFLNDPEMFKACSWYEKYGEPCLRSHIKASMMSEVKIKVRDLDGGKIVIQRGDTYIVVDNVNNASYTHQTLPYDIRSKLGMLKMVESDKFIANVGFKSDQECFFIFNDIELQHNEE